MTVEPPFRVCIECGAQFTEAELVREHLAVLEELGIVPTTRDHDAAWIVICPACTHDF